MYSFIAGILSAVSTALLSVFVTLKKISYMSEALSHISSGIALALLLGPKKIFEPVFVIMWWCNIVYIAAL